MISLLITDSYKYCSEKTKSHSESMYTKKGRRLKRLPFLSLLSDSNQRPRDYKSRALAN